jgi:sugar phosphate isomerase/epimerase
MMKIGLFSVIFANEKFENTLDKIQKLGLETVEIGTGNYCGDAHCKIDVLLKNSDRRKIFLEAVKNRNLEISAFSCHGNPLHPSPKIANAHHKTFVKTVLLAEKMGVPVVNCFSGTPGAAPGDKTPNWITCPWPTEYSDGHKWQWEKKLIPYWKKMAKYLNDHGVKAGLEMHPGVSVYNTESLLRLRSATGKSVGCNFDPSHLFWQGMNPTVCIRELKDAIVHCHAKDIRVYKANSDKNGVLDTKSYLDEINRSWLFRTVGYGHGMDFWTDFVSTLRLVGYNGTLSIEHEDSLMSGNEGLKKAVEFLKKVVLREDTGKAWWV